MSITTPTASTFALTRVSIILTGVTVAIGLLLLAGSLLGLPGVTMDVVAFVLPCCWAALLAGLAPVTILWRGGVMGAITGYFLGAGIRLVMCAGTAVVGIVLLHFPMTPLLLVMSAIYIPLMFVEAALIGRYLARLDGPVGGDHVRSPSMARTQAQTQTDKELN